MANFSTAENEKVCNDYGGKLSIAMQCYFPDALRLRALAMDTKAIGLSKCKLDEQHTAMYQFVFLPSRAVKPSRLRDGYKAQTYI